MCHFKTFRSCSWEALPLTVKCSSSLYLRRLGWTCLPGHEQAINDELGLQLLLSQFCQFPEPLAQKTSPVARLFEDSTFTYAGLALWLHSSPHGLKMLALFFPTAKHSDISTPCSLTLILFKRTPIKLPSLFKENHPLSVHSTKSRVQGSRKLCFQTVSTMEQSHFHSSSHMHRRNPLLVWTQTSTTTTCVGHCKSAKLAHFHCWFFYSQMDLDQLTDIHVLCTLLQPSKVIQEPSASHLKTTPRRKWEFHRYEGFAEW